MTGPHPRRNREDLGFTLIECLTGIAVLAIITTLAIPSFSSAISSWKLTTAANETLVAWQVARIESIKSNQTAVVCASSSQNAPVPGCSDLNPTGWIAFLDTNGNRSYEAEEQLLRTVRMPQGVRVIAEPASSLLVAFQPDGFAWSQGSVQLLNLGALLCLPASRSPLRRVAILAGSRMLVEKSDSSTNCQN